MNKFTTVLFGLALVIAMSMTGCTVNNGTENKVDPIATGEVIGFTYLLTKDELSESDRADVEAAYKIFSDVVNSDIDLSTDSLDIKKLLFAELDKELNKPEDEAKKVAVKIIINRIWSQVDTNFSIDLQTPTRQLAILKDVHTGIERGLGRIPIE